MKPFTPESALQWASARCAQRECCRSDFARKFAEGGLSRDEAESVLDRLVDDGFIDEARYARAFVHDRLEYDHWGRVKLRAALAQKGIARSDVQAALDGIDDEHYAEILRSVLAAKLRQLHFDPADRDESRAAAQKILRFAASRGFEADSVFRELDNVLHGAE